MMGASCLEETGAFVGPIPLTPLGAGDVVGVDGMGAGSDGADGQRHSGVVFLESRLFMDRDDDDFMDIFVDLIIYISRRTGNKPRRFTCI